MWLKLKTVRWSNYLELFGWVQFNYVNLLKWRLFPFFQFDKIFFLLKKKLHAYITIVLFYELFLVDIVDWREYAMWELWVFLQGYCLGHSISESSEKLFQRGGGKISVPDILVKGVYKQSSIYFFKSLLLVSWRFYC